MSDDLLDAVKGHHAALTDGLDVLPGLIDTTVSRTEAIDALESSIANLRGAFEDLMAEATETAAALDTTEDAATEFDSDCDEAADAVVAAGDAAETAVNEHDAAVDAGVATATEVFDTAEAAVQSTAERQTEAWTNTEAALIEHVRQNIEARRQEAEQSFEHTGAVLAAFGQHVDESILRSADQHLESLRTAAEHDAASHLQEAWNHAETQIRQSLDQFDASVRESAELLLQQGGSLVDELGRHIGLEVQARIAETFRELINSVLSALADEIKALLVEMTAGEAVTSALGPYLPEIIIVYKALQAVNALLDTLGI